MRVGDVVLPAEARPVPAPGRGIAVRPLRSEGTFFQLLDYSDISCERDTDFAIRLAREHGVASIPLTPFLHGQEAPGTVVRFCFAKRDDTLERAAERLRVV